MVHGKRYLEPSRNKRIFDALESNKLRIETALAETLSWERMTDNRASRICLYHKRAIGDSAEGLAGLCDWAVRKMIDFHHVIVPELSRLKHLK